MTEEKATSVKHLMMTWQTPERSQELFRVAFSMITNHKLIPNPLIYSLLYHFADGLDASLRKSLTDLLESEQGITPELAIELFHRYIYQVDEESSETIRQGLVTIVSQILGALVDIAGMTSISNKNIQAHLEKLSDSAQSKEVIDAVSGIISETRLIITETNKLDSHLAKKATELSEVVAELEHARKEAYIDGLTGIKNRRGFDREIDTLIEQADQMHLATFSMILIDLDHFKQINDSYGHILGDKVLRAVAGIMQQQTKGQDYCARYGGDEFVILLPDTTLNNAHNLAENIRRLIDKKVIKQARSSMPMMNISVSMGVAKYRLNESKDDYIARCDRALYRAKEAGRNQVKIAD